MISFRLLSSLLLLCGCVVPALCDERPVCFKGWRRTDNGQVTSNNIVSTLSCNSTFECALATLTFEKEDGNPGKIEKAFCREESAEIGMCATLKEANGPLINPDCILTRCKTFACNEPATPNGCSAFDLKTDVNMLPGCNLKESLDEITKCVAPLLAGYPYGDPSTCRENVGETISCVHRISTKCLSPFCTSLLDLLPVSMRKYYKQIMDNLEELTNGDSEKREIVMEEACFQSGSEGERQIKADLSRYAEYIRDVGADMKICNNNFIMELATAVEQAYGRFANSESRDMFCGTFSIFQSLLLGGWRDKCDETAVLDVITKILPKGYTPMIPQVKIALQVMEDFLSRYQAPNCKGGSLGSPPAETPAEEDRNEAREEENEVVNNLPTDEGSNEASVDQSAPQPANPVITAIATGQDASGSSGVLVNIAAAAKNAGVPEGKIADAVNAAKAASSSGDAAKIVDAVVKAVDNADGSAPSYSHSSQLIVFALASMAILAMLLQ